MNKADVQVSPNNIIVLIGLYYIALLASVNKQGCIKTKEQIDLYKEHFLAKIVPCK